MEALKRKFLENLVLHWTEKYNFIKKLKLLFSTPLFLDISFPSVGKIIKFLFKDIFTNFQNSQKNLKTFLKNKKILFMPSHIHNIKFF